MIEPKTEIAVNDLNSYYQYIQKHGSLLTQAHAKRWSRATLNMLGVNVSRKAKKELSKALPEELKRHFTDVFWLFYFRDTNISRHEFLNRIARRGGNTDPQFAYLPVIAVFGALKQLAGSDVSQTVAESLSPELREMWENA